MGAKEITDFLTYLAVKENVSASTQNQALFALLFLYRDVLKIDLPRIEGVIRQRRANYADLHAPFEKQIFCQKSARHLSNCAACRFK
jgi:chaperone required for assembly of F1-ATPase